METNTKMEEFKNKLSALLTEYNMNLVPFMNIQIQEMVSEVPVAPVEEAPVETTAEETTTETTTS